MDYRSVKGFDTKWINGLERVEIQNGLSVWKRLEYKMDYWSGKGYDTKWIFGLERVVIQNGLSVWKGL